MEQKYNKILNGEIDINNLSPNDLIDLELYLQNKKLDLNNILYSLNVESEKLLEEKNKLEEELNLLDEEDIT